MEENRYKVYVRTDDEGCIAEINSSAFISDASGWTEIDSGEGDKYRHAQHNYLEKALNDENGIANYKYEDGRAVERTEEEKAPETARAAALAEMAELKQRLRDTDHNIIKITEGAATLKEMSGLIAERREWRRRINELETSVG